MVWTAPKTWNVGDFAVSPELNTYSRDNMSYLQGDTTWTAVTFQNGWINYTGAGFDTCKYIRKGDYCFLRGLIQGTIHNTTATGKAFTLPVGYRPTHTRINLGWAAGGPTGATPLRIDVVATGEVVPGVDTPNGTVTAYVSLDGIFFECDGS